MSTMSVNSTLTIWQKATEDYKQRLTKDELEVISKFQDQGLLMAQIKSSSPTVYQASRLESIQSGLNRYAQFIAVFAFPVPEVANLLWGSIELIRKKSTISKEVESMIAGMLEQLCILAPRLRTYEKIFENMEGVEFAMISLYRSILEFFVEANAYIKRCSAWTSKIGACPEPIRMRQGLEDMKKFKTLVESEAWTANVDLHYKWHEEIHEILSNVKIQPKDSIPCRIIPYPPNSRFVGRKDTLQLLKSNLAISKNDQSSFGLYGMGGVGKTQIALKYIYDNLDRFPVILWMNADSRAKLTQSFVEAAKRINIEPEDSHSDAEAVAQTLKKWLSECKEEWLVVFDNADELNILKSLWPPGNRGTIILTSRDPSAAQVAKKGTLVKPLQPDEGVDLFLSLITPPDTERDDIYIEDSERIKGIVKLLGYLPLAIDQVGHFMLEKNCTVEDFHNIYKASMQSTDIFAQIRTNTSNFFYEHSLATVWRISIKTLSQNSNTLLSILACLDPDGIPETLLREGSRNNPDLKFLAETVSYFEATSELQRNGLVTKTSTQVRTTGTTQKRRPIRALSVHRLVQETVFHQQSAEDQNVTFSRAVTLCLKVFPHPTRTNFRLMHQWTECERYLPHLLALNNRFLDRPALDLGNDIVELFLYGSWYLYERRLPELALPLLKTACMIIEKKKDETDWFLKSRIEQCLGCVLFECSRFTESEAAFRNALAIREANISPNDILLAHGYQDTALPVTAQRRYNEALELQRKALEVIEQNKDDFTRRDMTFHVHHNMARTLEAAGGAERVREALTLHFHQGDPFGNGLRQEMSESGAVNLYAIGNCYLTLGEEEGVDYHTRALKIRKQLVGDQGFYYGISLHKMGRILFDRGSFSEAQDAFEQAQSIFENALDGDRELARTLWYLSTVKKELGDAMDSEQLASRARKLRSKLTGEVEQDIKHDCKGFDELVIYIHA